MIPRFMRSALLGVLSLGVAASVHAMPIADFVDDFANPAPAPGWSYLWNEFGAIGTAANYDPLAYNPNPGQMVYTTDGSDFPTAAPGSFTLIGLGRAHPGPDLGGMSTADPQGFTRYAIAAYTISMAGNYSVTDSFAQRGDLSGAGNGVRLKVFVNDGIFLVNTLVGNVGNFDGSQTIFNTSLGALTAGDTIYVAIGANGSDFFDSVNLDYTISKVSGPGALALFGLGLAGLGFARRRKATA